MNKQQHDDHPLWFVAYLVGAFFVGPFVVAAIAWLLGAPAH
jgi:uncharacterized protein (DUF983 family)